MILVYQEQLVLVVIIIKQSKEVVGLSNGLLPIFLAFMQLLFSSLRIQIISLKSRSMLDCELGAYFVLFCDYAKNIILRSVSIN